ncbi:hypothetical protein EMIHUDRAFT_354126, partial [Emiliania huxleyi CCMP1516]|uniref:Uncharacterized protein n=2 Tax=Emiliania huxleyi TaxID=2903 RepID=A0A0D3JQM0_EMIH1
GGAAERWGAADTATDPASEPADIAPRRGSVTQQCGVRCIISERAVSEHGERGRGGWRLGPPALECRSLGPRGALCAHRGDGGMYVKRKSSHKR